MASKPKNVRVFIVHHNGRKNGGCVCLGRYKIGARNETEAETLLREVVGKHAKVKVYYEDLKSYMPYGNVIKEC